MKNLKFTVHEIDEMTKKRPCNEIPEYLREAVAVCTVVNEIIKNIKTDLEFFPQVTFDNHTIVNLNLQPNPVSDYSYYKLFTNYLRACLETPDYADFEKQVVQKSYSPAEHAVLKMIKDNYFSDAVEFCEYFKNECISLYKLEDALCKSGCEIIFREMGIDENLMYDKNNFMDAYIVRNFTNGKVGFRNTYDFIFNQLRCDDEIDLIGMIDEYKDFIDECREYGMTDAEITEEALNKDFAEIVDPGRQWEYSRY